MRNNLDIIQTKVTNLIQKWKGYHLTIHGRITVVKTFIISQYVYIGAIIDLINDTDMNKIQVTLNRFIANNDTSLNTKNWINSEVMYSKNKTGGFNMLQLRDFFDAIKINWIKRYVEGIDDHWADLLDHNLNLNIHNRNNLLMLGAENPKINSIIKKDLPGLSRFFIALKRLINSFHGNKEAADNRWINSNIFFNPNFLIPDMEIRGKQGEQMPWQKEC